MEKVSVSMGDLAAAAWSLSYEQCKQIKWLAASVVFLSAGEYLIYQYTKKQADRINRLEQTVNTLVQITVDENPQEQQQSEE